MDFVSVMSPVYDLLSLGKKEAREKRKDERKKLLKCIYYNFFHIKWIPCNKYSSN